MAKIFIDGESGTTGLQIRDRLATLAGIEIIGIDAERRKDASAKRAVYETADIVILCLPDDAAKEAVTLADSLPDGGPRIIDASTAHRTAAGWAYGFAELTGGQAGRIAASRRVSNPGCYATGAIAILRPLTENGLVAADAFLTINAISGYTGGGKSMIAAYDGGTAPVFELYGLKLDHKHVPEIMVHGGLSRRPIFVPSVAAFPQGMIVSVPLQLDAPGSSLRASDIDACYQAFYGRSGGGVRYHGHQAQGDPAYLSGRLPVDPSAGSDDMELWLFSREADRQALVVARLDNLGKGAAGAAVQNLKLMLGLPGLPDA